MSAYEYFFYALYRWQSRFKDHYATPEVMAFFLTVALLSCAAYLLLEIVEISFRVSILPILSKTQMSVAVILFGIPQYFIFLHKGKYKQIVSKFQLESAKQRRVRTGAVIASIMLLFVLGAVAPILRLKELGH